MNRYQEDPSTIADAIVRFTKVYQRNCRDDARTSSFLTKAEQAETMYEFYQIMTEMRES